MPYVQVRAIRSFMTTVYGTIETGGKYKMSPEHAAAFQHDGLVEILRGEFVEPAAAPDAPQGEPDPAAAPDASQGEGDPTAAPAPVVPPAPAPVEPDPTAALQAAIDASKRKGKK